MSKTRFYLSADQSDRINFDSFAWNCGSDIAEHYYGVENVKEEEIAGLAREAWIGAICSDQIHSDIENEYTTYVDDLEEAEARWNDAWAAGFRHVWEHAIEVAGEE